jgi:hypothetical protein
MTIAEARSLPTGALILVNNCVTYLVHRRTIDHIFLALVEKQPISHLTNEERLGWGFTQEFRRQWRPTTVSRCDDVEETWSKAKRIA